MNKPDDPRQIATRNIALDAALEVLRHEGVLGVTHASISARTGISRSTLYRHWPNLDQLRNDAFKRAATPPIISPRTNGPLRADLSWLLGILMAALNDTPWGRIAPQVIAAAATDQEARSVIEGFMKERIASVEAVFAAAAERGELLPNAPTRELVEMAIAVPYFRRLIAGLPLDHEWLDKHVDMICRLAEKPSRRSTSK
ncbi:MAG: TetR/AcrR family transcriptional regulator [Hyphomicrobiaceae bacterium]